MEAKPLIGDLLEETQKIWKEQIDAFDDDDDVVLATSYRARLRFMEDSAGSDGPGFYGLVGKDGYAHAVLELTHRTGPQLSQLRLLNIHLEPSLDVDRRDREHVDITKAIDLITKTLSEALRLTFEEHPSSELKVYGRTDRMVAFVETVAVQLAEGTGGVPGLSIDTEGRWLVFRKS